MSEAPNQSVDVIVGVAYASHENGTPVDLWRIKASDRLYRIVQVVYSEDAVGQQTVTIRLVGDYAQQVEHGGARH